MLLSLLALRYNYEQIDQPRDALHSLHNASDESPPTGIGASLLEASRKPLYSATLSNLAKPIIEGGEIFSLILGTVDLMSLLRARGRAARRRCSRPPDELGLGATGGGTVLSWTRCRTQSASNFCVSQRREMTSWCASSSNLRKICSRSRWANVMATSSLLIDYHNLPLPERALRARIL